MRAEHHGQVHPGAAVMRWFAPGPLAGPGANASILRDRARPQTPVAALDSDADLVARLHPEAGEERAVDVDVIPDARGVGEEETPRGIDPQHLRRYRATRQRAAVDLARL